MHNVEFKIIVDSASKNTTSVVLGLIQSMNADPSKRATIKVSDTVNLKYLSTKLKSKFDCKVSSGVSDGCYGARTGKQFTGLTIWMHPSELNDRYLDSDYGEMVNPYHLLKENGELVENLDGETFLNLMETAGIEIKSDNTYNYSGNNTEDAQFMFDFQFDSVTLNDTAFLVVMFHCGGDIRGNYTSKSVWKFKYSDDVYGVLFPSKVLENESEVTHA